MARDSGGHTPEPRSQGRKVQAKISLRAKPEPRKPLAASRDQTDMGMLC